jgi:hypothetical protein
LGGVSPLGARPNAEDPIVSQPLDYQQTNARRRQFARRLFAVAATVSLLGVMAAVGGQLAHFGNGFHVFNLPGGIEYVAYGFVSGSRWLFWHDIALAAAVFPITWLVLAATRGLRNRR